MGVLCILLKEKDDRVETNIIEQSGFKPLPHNIFANRANSDQAALVRATLSGFALFAYENMIRYDPTLVDVTSKKFVLFTNMKVYLNRVGGA